MSLRYLTAGESHGPALVVVVEGLPAGLAVAREAIDRHLARRQQGYGRGRRQQIEHDHVRILSGIRHGVTLGTPIALEIENRDFAHWQEVMGADPVAPGAVAPRRVTRPRPGHADLAGGMKYGHRDLRNVLERASARETAARVAAGTLGRILLEAFGVELAGHVVMLAGVEADRALLARLPLPELARAAEASPVRCADAEAARRMMERIDVLRERGDTAGGLFEVRAGGVPPGLGSYAQWDRRLDARLAAALASIQAVKGVEVGDGFAAAGLPGSEVHDEIFHRSAGEPAGDEEAGGGLPQELPGHFAAGGYFRATNRAGGIEGGVTNGEPVVVRGAMKPLPTLYQPLRSVEIETKEPFQASVERSDACALPAAAVVGEAVVAWELAAAWVEKFGGDTLSEMEAAFEAYRGRLEAY
ncbi:chorismate synthase [Limnochorda pilosa]|uniref:Chorismate synthase n=1 Tax=Limnochorda pilosa TaxID=1555112 RepID=A0A0K2SN63_LIMPI|nr:chorismate synthase [Limnochorda pilosa]BAS28442.1 chorismate synthase [Limnochorda pilosa]